MGKIYIEMYRGDGPGTIIQRILLADAYCFYNKDELGGVLSDKKRSYWHQDVFYKRVNMFFNMSLKKIDRKDQIVKEEKLFDAECILKIVEKNIDKYCTDDWKKDVTKRVIDEKWKNNLSVHIRRGDVNIKNHPGRYLDDSVYISIIKKIISVKPGLTISLHSQKPFNGDLMEYKKNIKNSEITIHLDNTDKSSNGQGMSKMMDSILKDWKIMINSKVLLTSKSSFSYVPALLNTNEIHYIPFWHPKLKSWIDEKES
jgi:hypothetical protein